MYIPLVEQRQQKFRHDVMDLMTQEVLKLAEVDPQLSTIPHWRSGVLAREMKLIKVSSYGVLSPSS